MESVRKRHGNKVSRSALFVRGIIISALLCAALSALAVAQAPEWIEKFPSNAPPYYDNNCMTYDAGNQRIFYYCMQTWVWDGEDWTKLNPPTSPPPRSNASLAYDSARQRIVLFGGGGVSAGYFGDTWEFDGDTWIKMSDSGPSPRNQADMVYDARRGVMVLYGGYCNSIYRDTWEWNGSAWTKVCESGPPQLHGHAMAYDSHRGVTVLFGGAASGGSSGWSDQTWEWDGALWTNVTPDDRPHERDYHGMSFDIHTGRSVMYGGRTGVSQWANDTWEWDGTAWTKIEVYGPGAMSLPCLAYDAKRRETVFFSNSQTWVYNYPYPFGPEEPPVFVRGKGKPELESVSWESCGGPGTLRIEVERVASALLYLNNELIAGPEDFNNNTTELTFEVELAPGMNYLDVELRGKPGGTVRFFFTQE